MHAVLRVSAATRRATPRGRLLATVYDSARELLTWPRLAVAVGIGVVSWGGECLALYVILLGLGAAPSLALLNQATFALAAGSLVGSASLLPGGIGAAEGTVAAVLDLVAGQPRDVAAAATLLIRVCTLWFGVALGAASLRVAGAGGSLTDADGPDGRSALRSMAGGRLWRRRGAGGRGCGPFRAAARGAPRRSCPCSAATGACLPSSCGRSAPKRISARRS